MLPLIPYSVSIHSVWCRDTALDRCIFSSNRDPVRLSRRDLWKYSCLRRLRHQDQEVPMCHRQLLNPFDKNFDMAIIDNVTRNRIGMFQPPKIPVSILDNPKLIEAGVPKRLIYDLNEYLYKFSGIPLLREE